MRLVLVGWGAIGAEVARLLADRRAPVELVGIGLRNPDRALPVPAITAPSALAALRPDLVRHAEIRNDLRAMLQPEALRGIFVAPDMKAQTEHGGVGYAELATAENGRRLLDAIVARLVQVIQTLRTKQTPNENPK